jgi:tRNA modification GTPase
LNANRAILLTPPGGAAIAVVRLVGPGTGAFLRAHFSPAAREGRCVHGELRDGGKVIDDPVVVLHPGGDAADVNLHGGNWVIRATLDLARRAGFEVVESPGLPLPAEAVDAADELQQEILTHLPLARTDLALRMLLAQKQVWHNWLNSRGERPPSPGTPGEGGGEGDFDHQVPGRFRAPGSRNAAAPRSPNHLHPNPLPEYREREREAAPLGPAEILADRTLWWLLHPPRVAIVGAPNVGKSTLANQLFARERSITADLPGTTRDWVGELADVNGLAVMLVDTPGLRDAADPIERAAIAGARGQIAAADLVVLVLDPTRPLAPEQSPLLDAHRDALRVINKSDRPAQWELLDRRPLRTVATTGEGVEQLRSAITARFGCDAPDLSRPRWWTERQRILLEEKARRTKHALLSRRSRTIRNNTESENEK